MQSNFVDHVSNAVTVTSNGRDASRRRRDGVLETEAGWQSIMYGGSLPHTRLYKETPSSL